MGTIFIHPSMGIVSSSPEYGDCVIVIRVWGLLFQRHQSIGIVSLAKRNCYGISMMPENWGAEVDAAVRKIRWERGESAPVQRTMPYGAVAANKATQKVPMDHAKQRGRTAQRIERRGRIAWHCQKAASDCDTKRMSIVTRITAKLMSQSAHKWAWREAQEASKKKGGLEVGQRISNARDKLPKGKEAADDRRGHKEEVESTRSRCLKIVRTLWWSTT